jgi:rhodanese-related sulfurtransferase
MTRSRVRAILVVVGLGLAVAGAALGSARVRRLDAVADANLSLTELEPFEVARVLAVGGPETVVMLLDAPRHAMVGAAPAVVFGASDEALAQSAPRARRLVVVGADAVRVDRLARRLRATGRDVRVLRGGTEAWDRAMGADPAAPAASGGEAALRQHREQVALRRRFGEAKGSGTAAPPAGFGTVRPIPATGNAAKKRGGC